MPTPISRGDLFAAFFSFWLSGKVYADSSTAVRLKTFLMETFLIAMKMAQSSNLVCSSHIWRGLLNLWGNSRRRMDKTQKLIDLGP